MTIALYGKGVSHGIAIGNVHIVETEQLDIREYGIKKNAIDNEVRRFEEAVASAQKQLRDIKKKIPKTTGVDIASFIDTHLLMLEDAVITHDSVRLIRNLACNAEWALKLQRDALVAVFEEMDNEYLRTRKDDVDYVVNRIQRILLNQSPKPHEVRDMHLSGNIILANDLTPADTVLMQHQGIAAFATEYGGPTSHTAILARSLGIPAIVGLQHALRYINEEDFIIIDGNLGVALVDPDNKTLAHYKKLGREEKKYYTTLSKLKKVPAKTLDGEKIKLQANIELPRDFDTVHEVGASGVGLYRTEFLYMNRESPPDEEEHYQTYVNVIKILAGLPLTIRTLDLGADKQVDGGRQSGPIASNPALGLRAIRLCLKEPDLFKPQLRAILRASEHGPVRIMIPMLSNTHEMHQVLLMISDIRNELTAEGISFDQNVPVGAMIEVPAAAVCADIFAKHLDFLSIGTNDLIQYTIAIDRVNDEVNYLYDPIHPAVLRLIYGTLKAGKKAKKPVAMCGEMAGDTHYTRLLLGLGLREFSVHPASLLEVKRIINNSKLKILSAQAQRALKARSGAEVARIMNISDPLEVSAWH